MSEKRCPVEECTDPECKGNPYEVDSSQPDSVRMIQAGLVEGWLDGHRSAAKYAQVIERALKYTYDGILLLEIAQAREDPTAEELKKAVQDRCQWAIDIVRAELLFMQAKEASDERV